MLLTQPSDSTSIPLCDTFLVLVSITLDNPIFNYRANSNLNFVPFFKVQVHLVIIPSKKTIVVRHWAPPIPMLVRSAKTGLLGRPNQHWDWWSSTSDYRYLFACDVNLTNLNLWKYQIQTTICFVIFGFGYGIGFWLFFLVLH